MKLNNPTLFSIIYHGQQANSISGSQPPMHGGHSYLPLDHIVPPPAEEMINDIGEESDGDTEMRRPNPRCFPTTKTGFHKFKQKPHRKIIRQQRYLEVIRNCALGLFADFKQSVVPDKDVAWQREHDHIVNPHTVGSLANRKCASSSCQAAN